MRTARTRAGILVLGSSLLLVHFACNFDPIPNQECNGDKVVYDSPPAGQRNECAQCLELKCCDDVGDCSGNASCNTAFKRSHECVRKDFSKEVACVSGLEEAPRRLYNCMRTGCANECSVPSCVIAPTVQQLGVPQCDRCVTSNCCAEINRCYENRRCKLALECMVRECARELGPAIAELGSRPPNAIDELARGYCNPDGGIFGVPNQGPPPCISRCILDFTTGENEDQLARCSVVGIYACSAKGGCGAACTPPAVDAATD
jgi:hypothetical protein